MNEYDSNRISNLAKKVGYTKTDNIDNIDCYVLNTCHIREKASEKLFSDLGRIKKLKKTKPLKIAVTGCVAQAESKEIISRAPYVDLVLGPQSYHRFPEMLRKIENALISVSLRPTVKVIFSSSLYVVFVKFLVKFTHSSLSS